ncbi:unnamed protein product [Arctogadus glacialis]
MKKRLVITQNPGDTNTFLCNRILHFLMGRALGLRTGDLTSTTLSVSTGDPSGLRTQSPTVCPRSSMTVAGHA